MSYHHVQDAEGKLKNIITLYHSILLHITEFLNISYKNVCIQYMAMLWACSLAIIA
jgi:hypothetical protein